MLFNFSDEIISCWESIPQPVAVHNETKCLYANLAFLTLMGISRAEEVIGTPMSDFFAPWPNSIRLGTRTATGRRHGAPPVEIEITCLPVIVEGRNLYQSLVRDITEFKKWEGKLIQTERLTAMGKMASEIAHELNNPLGGILLYANLVREEIPEDSNSRANLEKIVKLATRCRIIAKGLLNFGRFPQNTYSLVDINRTVREMFSLVEDHKLFKNLGVKMQLDEHLPHIMGDKGQIEQVVLNLIGNAGEAMNGNGCLVITTDLIDEKRVVLKVEDTGSGMSKEVMDRIFEPFFTTKKPGRGTGLGLAIAHGIVQRHGGKINVQSTMGKGSTFEVILPVI